MVAALYVGELLSTPHIDARSTLRSPTPSRFFTAAPRRESLEPGYVGAGRQWSVLVCTTNQEPPAASLPARSSSVKTSVSWAA